MNVTATIPATWKPNDTKAINKWFDKIHNHVQKQKLTLCNQKNYTF